jgi:glycosyl transferase family 25
MNIVLLILLIIVLITVLIKNIKKNKEAFATDLSNDLSSKIDIVYYINLDKRTDRKEEIIGELNKLNLKSEQIERVPGVYIEDFGALGCSYSHIECLKRFIKSNKNNCIIFEDDFMFKPDINFIELLNNFFDLHIDYDVCMLSINPNTLEDTEISFLKKVNEGQTASGYIVNKKFANVLLDNLIKGAELLKKTHNQPLYMNDQYWKKIQPDNNWYVFNPTLGTQRPSYSDINKKFEDYKV